MATATLSGLSYNGPLSRFYRRRRVARTTARRQKVAPFPAAATEKRVGPFEIQGKRASDIEYTCYLALKALGWQDGQLEFQVSTLGGRNPGGSMLDFVVWSNAGPIVIEVNGDTWHSTTESQRQRDLMRSARITEAWGSEVQYIVLTTGDLVPDEVAVRNLRQLVGRGG